MIVISISWSTTYHLERKAFIYDVTGTGSDSITSTIRQKRKGDTHKTKAYEICKHYSAPDASDFFALGKNKAALLNYLCVDWSAKPLSFTDKELYLGGGFKEELKPIWFTNQQGILCSGLDSHPRRGRHPDYSSRYLAAENGAETGSGTW